MEQTVRDYWGFAFSRAFWYSRHAPNGDRGAVESDALFGLLMAARSWDPSVGVSLTAHVRTRINYAIVDGYRERLGRHGERTRGLSLDALFDIGWPDAGFDDVESADLAACAVALFDVVLTSTEREVMTAIYVDGESQKDVAERRRVSDSAVCCVHRRAVRKLRHALSEDGVLWDRLRLRCGGSLTAASSRRSGRLRSPSPASSTGSSIRRRQRRSRGSCV